MTSAVKTAFFILIILSNLAFGVIIGFLSEGNIPVIVTALVIQLMVTSALLHFGIRLYTRSLTEMKERLEKILSGDGVLDVYCEKPGNDIVQTAVDTTNRLLDRFRRDIISLKNNWRKNYELNQDILSNSNMIFDGINLISSSTESLEETARKLDHEIDDSKNVISLILISLNEARKVFQEQTSAVTESSASIEELIASIRNIASISEAKKSTLSGLTEIVLKGKTDIDKTISVFTAIGETTKQMMDLVNIIGEITEKTNLLAMNAAIEAARAGNQGKGFAVVAVEIKKLAESSKNAVDTITTTLKEIAERIQRAVGASSSINGNIDEIKSNVESTASSMEEILNGMSEISQGTSQISQALSLLVNSTVDAKRHTDSIFSGTSELNGSLGAIENHSRTNVSAAHDIAGGVHQISDSIQLLFRISENSSKDMTFMKKLLEKTKTKKKFLCDYIPPSQYIETDKIVGVFAEIVELMCAETGEEPVIEFMPWDQVLAVASETPGIFIMTILRTVQREKKFRWIGPVIPDVHGIFRLRDRSDIVINSVEDLRKYRVGCVENNYSYKYFIDSGVPVENITTSKIHTMSIQNLILGKVDIIPLGSLQAIYQLKAMNRPPDLLVKTIDITGFSTDQYMATSLLTPDKEFSAYEKAFEKVSKTEAYRAILRKYGG